MIDEKTYVNIFISKYEKGIKFLCKNNSLSFDEILNDLINILEKEYIDLCSKSFDYDLINDGLFYKTNIYFNLIKKPIIQKKYLCPGCLFFNKKIVCNQIADQLKCIKCNELYLKNLDPKKYVLYKTFSIHSKLGYKCLDCNRFIPKSFILKENLSCPYLDCCFIGNVNFLKKMQHPIADENEIIIDNETLFNNNINNVLQPIIDEKINNIIYFSHNSTLNFKNIAYKSFSNLMEKNPSLMEDYLLNNSRAGGLQHKLFQEYISILEKSLPFSFLKNKKVITISNLLDQNISIFDGVSSYEEEVSDNLIVKNSTKEFYIGGRKGTYAKPFYIGKLLNVELKSNNKSILENVVEYSFSQIKLQNIKPGTKVIVTHLRIPPHYQMGAMVYINRARKSIVEEINEKLQ